MRKLTNYDLCELHGFQHYIFYNYFVEYYYLKPPYIRGSGVNYLDLKCTTGLYNFYHNKQCIKLDRSVKK